MLRGVKSALALASLLVLMSVQPAPATTTKAGPFRYVEQATSAPAGAVGDVSSLCPADTRLTGGGATIAGPADQVRVSTMAPTDLLDPDSDADDAFAIGTSNVSAAPRQATALGICLKGGATLDYVTADGSVINMGASVGTSRSVSCLGGRAVGGGIEIQGPHAGEEVKLNSTHPNDTDSDGVYDDGWSGKFNISNSSVARNPNAHVVCLPSNAMRFRYRFQSKVAFPGVATLSAKCPAKGFHVSGGGLQGFFSRVLASMPFDSKDKGKAPDDGWKVRAWNSTGVDPTALLVHAICLKKK